MVPRTHATGHERDQRNRKTAVAEAGSKAEEPTNRTGGTGKKRDKRRKDATACACHAGTHIKYCNIILTILGIIPKYLGIIQQYFRVSLFLPTGDEANHFITRTAGSG